MTPDIDDVGAVDTARQIIALEDEVRGIGAAIDTAVRAGDLVLADQLLDRQRRLPLLLGAARAHDLRLDLAALAEEARTLDLELPELARDLEATKADAARIRADALAAIRAADHKADVALSVLKERQDRRRAIEQRLVELRAALASIGSGSTSTRAKSVTIGSSCDRPDYTILGDDVRGIG